MLTQIKFYRLSKDIKASDLAEKACISVSMLSKIETGKCRGSRSTRQKLAEVLEVPEKLLFGK